MPDHSPPERHRIDPAAPRADIIQRAADVLRSGGVIVFPTRGLYGLGADARNAAGVARIFTLKGRPAKNPLLVIVGRRDMLDPLVNAIPPAAAFLMDRFWPGGVTFVLEARPGLARGICSTQGRIGVRLAGHPVAAALSVAIDGPITGTSANLSGTGGCADIDAIQKNVLEAVDLVLDAGPLAGGSGSTVVDVTGQHPVILREGVVPGSRIMACYEAYCTGGGPVK